MASTTALSGTMMNTSFLRKQPVRRLRSVSNFGQGLFGLKGGSCGGQVVAMAQYNVKLITPEGEKEFSCPDDVYILDHADDLGIDLPYSCRAGSCSSCAGKVVSGQVDQSDGSYLEDEQAAEGWVLTCVAYPVSDVVIETHKEKELVG